jgi:hypothetical protein
VPLDTAPPRSRRVAVAAAGLAAAAAVLVAAVVLARGDDEGGGGLAGATTTTTTATGVLPAADGCAGRPIVSVVNGTAIAGLATAARDRLAELGWDATSGNGAQVTATQLLVDEGYEDIAREVAGVLGLDTTPEPMPDQVPVGADFFADVVVIVGPGFTPPGPARRVLGIDGFEYTSNFCDRTSGGGLVAVENDDDVAHTVTSTSGSWPAVEVEAGADGAFEVPAEAGSYEYFCTIHGAAVMAGTLVVTAGS